MMERPNILVISLFVILSVTGASGQTNGTAYLQTLQNAAAILQQYTQTVFNI